MSDQKKFGRALALLRSAAGKRQKDVAELLGVKTSSVGRLEVEGANPRVSTVLRYLDAVDRNWSDLARALHTVAGGDETPPDDGEGSQMQQDLAWLTREVVALGREHAALRKDFHRFRSEVAERLLHEAAKNRDGDSGKN